LHCLEDLALEKLGEKGKQNVKKYPCAKKVMRESGGNWIPGEEKKNRVKRELFNYRQKKGGTLIKKGREKKGVESLRCPEGNPTVSGGRKTPKKGRKSFLGRGSCISLSEKKG